MNCSLISLCCTLYSTCSSSTKNIESYSSQSSTGVRSKLRTAAKKVLRLFVSTVPVRPNQLQPLVTGMGGSIAGKRVMAKTQCKGGVWGAKKHQEGMEKSIHSALKQIDYFYFPKLLQASDCLSATARATIASSTEQSLRKLTWPSMRTTCHSSF